MLRNFHPLTILLLSVLTIPTLAQTTFTQNGIYGSNGEALITGDFNLDGWPDLAMVRNRDELAIFLGNSTGVFSNGPTYTLDSSSQCDQCKSMTTGDFNNDGILDIAVAFGGDEESFQPFWGMGDGSFVAGSKYSLPAAPVAIQAGNFNSGKVPDIVIAECSDFHGACTIQIWTSNSNKTFSLTQSFNTPAATQYPRISRSGLVIADMNRDGRDDVVAGADGKVQVYAGTGTGTVKYWSTLTPPSGTVVLIGSISAGTLDHGTSRDLVIQGSNGGAPDCCQNIYTFVYLNNGNATSFTRKQTFLWSNVVNGGEVAITDVNGDRKLDLLFVNESPTDGRIGYAYGNHDGTFQAIHFFISSGDPDHVITRDLNRDSRHDFAISDDIDGLIWFTNDNATTNCSAPSSASQNIHLCSAYWNKDHISVMASGNAPVGVKRLEVWIDGVKKYQVYNDQLRAGFKGLSSGSHKVAVHVVDVYDKSAKKIVYVQVP